MYTAAGTLELPHCGIKTYSYSTNINCVFFNVQMQLSLPATFKSFSSSFLEIGQKHIPYTIGPGKKLHIF